MITTNTFMSGRGPMERAGVGDRFAGGLRAAVRVAQEAIADTAQRPVAIAGSISATPWGSPVADADPAALRRLREDNLRQVEILAEAGAEVIALEMVRDRRLAEPAIEAALAWERPHWTYLAIPVEQLTAPAAEWLALGATILGGCCGLGAEHTAALRALADARRTMLGLADGR